MIAYQIGALQALAAYSDMKVTHLKPHGALNNMAAENKDYALAIGRAIKAVDRNIIYVALMGSEMEKAGHELGLKVAREGFCDRQYDDDGNLTSRKIPSSVYHDPEVAKKQVIEMVVNKTIVSRHGKRIPCDVDTLCVHGDEPTGVAVATAVRAGPRGRRCEGCSADRNVVRLMSRIVEEMVVTPDVVDPARLRSAIRRAREFGVVLPTFSELAKPPSHNLDRIDPDEPRSENLWRVNWYNGPDRRKRARCARAHRASAKR